jgi:polysaccharide export outer membrane protein
MAGGLTDKASSGRIRIIRKVDGVERVISKVKMDEPVFPDDVVIVPESYF